MRIARILILVGFYLLFLAGLSLWILTSTEPARPSLPTRTRPPLADR